jgi:hypothetical protein
MYVDIYIHIFSIWDLGMMVVTHLHWNSRQKLCVIDLYQIVNAKFLVICCLYCSDYIATIKPPSFVPVDILQ